MYSVKRMLSEELSFGGIGGLNIEFKVGQRGLVEGASLYVDSVVGGSLWVLSNRRCTWLNSK